MSTPGRDYAERLMRAYWQQRPEGARMSDDSWVPDTETDRMLAALDATATPRPLPEWVQVLSSSERQGWQATENLYEAIVAYSPGSERTYTPFRDLRPDVQSVLTQALLPIVRNVHGVGLNPNARADAGKGESRG